MSSVVTVKEAADILGLSVPSINLYLKNGKLHAQKEGRRNMILRSEVEALALERGSKSSRKEVAEAPVKEKHLVSPPVPVAVPPTEPLVEVPVRSIVELTERGVAWRMNLETHQWEQVSASGVALMVVERKDNEGQMFLMCRAADSNAPWSIAEADVLSGNFTLVSRPVVTPENPPDSQSLEETPEAAEEASEAPVKEADPEPSREEQQASDEDVAAQKAKLDRRTAYKEALNNYVPANEARLRTASDFKKVDKDFRPIIWSYLEDFGEESTEGKRDCVVEDFGYKAIITFTEGATVVQHDVPAIVNWALETGHTEVLTYGVKFDKWDELKENGIVPAEFISQVEEPKKLEDRRKLVINRLKGEKEE